LEKMLVKLDMNGVFGKFSSKRRPKTVVVFALEQVPSGCEIVNVVKMPMALDGTVKYIVSYMDQSPHIGMLKSIASFITSRARSRLAIVRYEVSRCKTLIGIPPRVCYTDTDSLHIIELDVEDPYTADFISRWFDPKVLGKLKHEVPEGITHAKFLAKKVNICLLSNPQERVQTYAELLEAAISSPKSFMVKCKGVAKRLARPEDLIRLSSKSVESCEFFTKVAFQKSFAKGMIKITDRAKSLRSGDRSRMAPDPLTGFCAPLPFPMLSKT
jgi:hypothetical protein